MTSGGEDPDIAKLKEEFGGKSSGADITPIKNSGLPIIWVLGGPGSGKGTQCDKIISTFGYGHISTGDLLRDEVAKGTARAELLKSIMASGKLVPMEIVLELLKEAMLDRLKQDKKGFLIDGYPREEIQGVQFEKEIGPASIILYFECSADTLLARLQHRAKTSGRADDNLPAMQTRIKTFLENNDGIIKAFESKVVRINAERNVDEIFADVNQALSSIKK